MNSPVTSPVRLYVYFKLDAASAGAWRARWQAAATAACQQLPGLNLLLSERPPADDSAPMTWMESYRGSTPQQMADGEALMAQALGGLGAERQREVFVDTFRAG